MAPRAWPSRQARNGSSPTSPSRACAWGSTINSATRTPSGPGRRRRTPTAGACTRNRPTCSSTPSPSTRPMPARTASCPARRARPGMPPSTWAGGCGAAPSCGSIPRSTRASAYRARWASPDTSAARPTSSAPTTPTRGCPGPSFARPSTWAAPARRSRPHPTSWPDRRRPIGWCSPLENSGSRMSSTPTSTPTMPAPISSTGPSSIPDRSTTPRMHGASPTGRRWNGTRAPGRFAAACSTSRSCPTAPSWTPASNRCNGSARSSGATSFGASPASSPSPAS